MNMSISTIAQWAVIILGGLAWYFYKQTKSAAARQKQLDRTKGAALWDEGSGTEKKKKSKASAPKDKKPMEKKAAVPSVQVDKSEADEPSRASQAPENNKEELDSLQRLAGMKQGKKNKEKSPASSKKDAKKAPSNANQAPSSPAMGNISSTSSTTGADGDISEAFDDEVQGSSTNPNDMLETGHGPSVMRITPSEDPFKTVQRRSRTPTEKKEPLSKTQKKNAKKAEQRKQETAENRELQRERLEAHKRGQRLAREAEAAKQGGSSSAAPASNAWSAGGPKQNSSSELLDTFDRVNTSSATPLSSSDVEAHSYNGEDFQLSDDQRRDIPADVLAEIYAERGLKTEPQEQWIEVKKTKKDKKKGADPAAATAAQDSDSNRAPTPTIRGNEGKKVAEKGGFQDIDAGSFPKGMETVSGWDAHAW